MTHLILVLLGADYLRHRWRALAAAGIVFLLAGAAMIVDALDGVRYFPIGLFAILFVVEGLATLAIAHSGVGGQRVLRYTKGLFVLLAGGLILAGQHHGNFVLSMIFGLLFLLDGLIQCLAGYVVRYPRWRYVFAWGVLEILMAIFFFQPYPTHYAGTLPYCMGLFLAFAGLKLLSLSWRAKNLDSNPAFLSSRNLELRPTGTEMPVPRKVWDGPPEATEHALTVHVWTPSGSARTETRNYPVVGRYIVAVDVNGVVSTGHAALEAPEGIYISLYPGVEIDRSPDEFGNLLRATEENNVPGVFQPDYATEAQAWRPSNVQVRIRNYDAGKLRAHWESCRELKVYNLTHRNCSSTVSGALEAALEGVVGRLHGPEAGWGVLLRLLMTPELWVAAQIRQRALTMAWTPGLTLDYARALSMLADPRPFGWWKMLQSALRQMSRLRARWRREDQAAHKPRS
ncbi:hypothetical protein PIGHUM_02583 [Pigmentiphaga humi]|uniref:DUF308 domain-containing protein n=1 Tax=Pigmentiphaga humi TaxID=2478468 RepID=A0A3P4B3L6_9BURK|nr:DUF308 domain-containing protein [Pigmentiphaga humi]VCU70511.1 hypothetical protein PIGHUM_02583 [Pigmentiphaga humi]